MPKLINVNCLHFIGCQNYTNVLINRVLYQIQVTALLSTILSKHITSALTAVKDHVMKYSETAFSNSNVNYFWSIKNSSEVIEKLRLRNFQGSQVSSFDFSTLYTSLPHDLIKAKVLSLVNWCFNRESKSYLCTSHLRQDFLATRNMTRIDVGLARSYVKLLLSSWKTYMCNLMAWYINK